ncbi:Rieske (2Fe-2S) protein [Tenacibaculum maritimum]|uniref:Rieske (2Fe-2S) protein n=1 Tax=Tenacibaculum maritimum TaxID=107401 RepID=UPI0038770A6B
MRRKEFLKSCGYACLGATMLGTLFESCVSVSSVVANLEGDCLVVQKSDFKKEDTFLKYLIVRNDALEHSIYVFRFSENEYRALYLKCTHQGNELSPYGEKLVCGAHGSEFNSKGIATHGPATEPLRKFPVYINKQQILISLRKI